MKKVKFKNMKSFSKIMLVQSMKKNFYRDMKIH